MVRTPVMQTEKEDQRTGGSDMTTRKKVYRCKMITIADDFLDELA
jgi:hypothetical protein